MKSKKIALVTGGSRGIGKAICYELANNGYHVIVHYSKSEQSAKQISSDINGDITSADLANEEDINNLASFIKDKYGTIDLLINNAGIAKLDSLNELTSSDFNKTMNINLLAHVLLTQKIYPIIKSGSIIFISSGCAFDPTPDALSYAMSKAGIEIFVKSIACELAPNIRVNTVAPGCVDTDMYQENYTSDDQKWVKETNPMGCPRTIDEIAKTVSFLASDAAKGIVGQTIRVNGGSNLK